MRIYLDTCSLQRPLDTKTHIRIALEAEAVLGLLALCEAGELELVSSEALLFEVQRTPSVARQEYALGVISRAKLFIVVTGQVETRARALYDLGIKPLDALHLASAEEAQVDYFCTCDDRLLRRAQGMKDVRTKVVSPIELAEEVEKR